jgi:hypothetical protein
MRKRLWVFAAFLMSSTVSFASLAETSSAGEETNGGAKVVANLSEKAEPGKAGDRDGLTAFERIKGLEGEWEAPLHGTQEGKRMVNTFGVIGEGSAVLHGEWLDGRQLTATVFYLVGSELRADHFCDLKN